MRKIILLLLLPIISFAQRIGVADVSGTMISTKATGGFNYTDLKASTGDVQVRLFKSDTIMWMVRNRSTDKAFEIYDASAGGRLSIQKTTGYMGVGVQGANTHQLTVRHTGSSGILSQSTSSYSAIDIDAFSGDAALRFANNGVNQWNLRNRPGDDYFELFELGGGGSRLVVQDGTGNVGIGETSNPTYRLDVLHAGSTGIRSRSASTFSVIDIDAANGDAALRFQKAGEGQWNTRSRPADDYYEIFELGGGGSRFVIQDGTGNVGIGETTSPSYRLDVLHGGATGIRSRSSSTFSLIDIDGANGDAALRFAKAGVNQWNIRNDPATDNLQIFELGGGGERLRIENGTGNVVIAGNLAKGGGSFKIDHPLDPTNKYLYHSFVESPDMMNIYNGNITTDASGKAKVKLPDYFEALNMEFRYQLTVIGSFSQAIVAKEIEDNTFEVATDKPNVKVSWQVTGVRQDAYAKSNRIMTEELKKGEEKGKYLHPKAFGKPETMGVWYRDDMKNARTNGPTSSIDDTPVTSGVKAVTQTIVGTSVEQKKPAATNVQPKTVEGPQSIDEKK